MKNLYILLKIFLFSLAIPFFAGQACAQTASTNQLRVVIYGNDLTSDAYLPSDKTLRTQLEQKLRVAGFDVVVENINDPNLTTANAFMDINNVIGRAPDAVILQLGEADISLGLPAIRIFDNLMGIVKILKKKNIYVVAIGVKKPPRMEKSYAASVDKYFGKLKGYVTLLPLPLEKTSDTYSLTLGDGHHPNASGIASIVETLYPSIDTGLRWRIKVINEWRDNNNNF